MTTNPILDTVVLTVSALDVSGPLWLVGCGRKTEQGGREVGLGISESRGGVSPTLTLADHEVIESLLSQEHDIKDLKKHVITDTTSDSMLHSGTYDAFSKSLRAEAKSPDAFETLIASTDIGTFLSIHSIAAHDVRFEPQPKGQYE